MRTVSDDDWDKIKAAKKFPEQFKDPMFEVGKKAVELGVVGDALYDTLPLIIRYNRFTMKVRPRQVSMIVYSDTIPLHLEIHSRQNERLPDRVL
jgi:hypothetical protein